MLRLPTELDEHESLVRAALIGWDRKERDVYSQRLERILADEPCLEDAHELSALRTELQEISRVVEWYGNQPPKSVAPYVERARTVLKEFHRKEMRLDEQVNTTVQCYRYARSRDADENVLTPLEEELESRLAVLAEYHPERAAEHRTGLRALEEEVRRTQTSRKEEAESDKRRYADFRQLQEAYWTTNPERSHAETLQHLDNLRRETRRIVDYATERKAHWLPEANDFLVRLDDEYLDLEKQSRESLDERLSRQFKEFVGNVRRSVNWKMAAIAGLAAFTFFYMRNEQRIKQMVDATPPGGMTPSAVVSTVSAEEVNTLKRRIAQLERSRNEARPSESVQQPAQASLVHERGLAIPYTVLAFERERPDKNRFLYTDTRTNMTYLFLEERGKTTEVVRARSSDGINQGPKQREWDKRTPRGAHDILAIHRGGLPDYCGGIWIEMAYKYPGNGLFGASPDRVPGIRADRDISNGGIIMETRDAERFANLIEGHERQTLYIIEDSAHPLRGR